MKAPDLDSKGRNRNEYVRCKKCGASELDVGVCLQPTMSCLVFGSFPKMHIPMEYRCDDCEKKVTKSIKRMLRNL